MEKRLSLIDLLPWLVLAGVSLFVFWRCHFGIDFTDEGQYLAQGFVPLIGGGAFKSDLFLQQTPALFLSPLLWLYVKCNGSFSGLVFFFRFLWLSIAFGCAVRLYWRFAKKIGPEEREKKIALAAASSFLLLFIPFNIPSPSYNSLGTIFLTMALVGTELLSVEQLLWLALALFCYPPFGAAAALLIVFGLWQKRKVALRPALIFSVSCALLTGIGVLAVGRENIINSLHFTSYFGTFSEVDKFALWRFQFLAIPLPLLLSTAFCFVGLAVFPSFACLFFLFSAAVYFFVDVEPVKTHTWILLFVLQSLPLLWRQKDMRLYAGVGVACGLLSAYASSNGLVNFSIGAFPVFFLALLAGFSSANEKKYKYWTQTVAIALLLSAFFSSALSYFYREGALPRLTSKINFGPYSGIATTPERAEFLISMESDLMELQRSGGSILFFYNFPAGYFLTALTPATKMLNLLPQEYNDKIRGLLLPKKNEEFPEWVINIKSVPDFVEQMPLGDPALNFVFSGQLYYNAVIERHGYAIFRKRH